jgi:hypothetical protein
VEAEVVVLEQVTVVVTQEVLVGPLQVLLVVVGQQEQPV